MATVVLAGSENPTTNPIQSMIYGKMRPVLTLAQLLAFFIATTDLPANFDPARFKNPPASARPMVWMQIVNGNCSAAGLTKDLESLARVGVGGVILFELDYGIPAGDIPFNSAEFRSLVSHAAREAGRLGLTFGVHNCDGWSSSGGPWISPADSMKRVVASETVATGGHAQRLQLPRPPRQMGYYRDLAVIACPADESDLLMAGRIARLESSGSRDDPAVLLDYDLDKGLQLLGDTPWLQFNYEKPYQARSITLDHRTRGATAELLVSDDGKTFRRVTTLSYYRTGKAAGIFTATFPTVSARYFRVTFSKPVELCHVELSHVPRLADWPAQNGMARKDNDRLVSSNDPAAEMHRPEHGPRVLSSPIGPDETVTVDLPAGIWQIMRFGYTTTGAVNYPASAAGRGLECDKMSAQALEKHFAAYVDKVAAECGALTGQTLKYVVLDSYEMGGQNWTEDLASQFRRRKGYDLTPYLPLLVGCGVDAPATDDAVLRDFRSCLAELMQENYHRTFTELCHRRGLRSYIEPYGFGPFDHLQAGGAADIPMGEFWLDLNEGTNLAVAVSAGHTYGKPVISAESFTAWGNVNWKLSPSRLKFAGDYAWAQGINELTFHRFVHQANVHVRPGMTMGDIGAHIDRTQTWWENVGPAWTKYVQRGSYLLRQGAPMVDLLVYVGEASPQPSPTRAELCIPDGYNYDLCDTEVLLNRLTVSHRQLTLPGGMRYQALMLTNSAQLSVRVLSRIEELTNAGVIVFGQLPVQAASRSDAQAASQEFTRLGTALSQSPVSPIRPLPQTTQRFATELTGLGVDPDIAVSAAEPLVFTHRHTSTEDLYFLVNNSDTSRRQTVSFRVAGRIPESWDATTGDTQRLGAYSVEAGRTVVSLDLPARSSQFVLFRLPASDDESVTNVTPPSPHATAHLAAGADGRSYLQTASSGPYRLRFASGREQVVAVPTIAKPLLVTGPWRVDFPGEKGGLLQVSFPHLTDWRVSDRPEIRYYSGTAVYTGSFNLPANWLPTAGRAILDLGQVEICAEVTLNGTSLGLRWFRPFAFDATAALLPGRNDITIRVTNLWTNRLIGDNKLPRTDGYSPDAPMPRWYVENRPPPPGPRQTFTTYDFYESDQTLVPSGLLGPVTLAQEAVVPLR